MVVYPEGVIYMLIKPDDIAELVEEHLVKGRVLQRLLYREPTTEEIIPTMQEIPFFALQELRVLRNRGLIDPEKIEEYIARDGYTGMAKALTEMTPEQIVKEILDSGLRGPRRRRFPHGTEMEVCRVVPRATSNTCCATPTKATRAPSWTGASWKQTPTPFWKAWSSPPRPSARITAISTAGPSIPWPSTG